jgi:hypothetical protein
MAHAIASVKVAIIQATLLVVRAHCFIMAHTVTYSMASVAVTSSLRAAYAAWQSFLSRYKIIYILSVVVVEMVVLCRTFESYLIWKPMMDFGAFVTLVGWSLQSGGTSVGSWAGTTRTLPSRCGFHPLDPGCTWLRLHLSVVLACCRYGTVLASGVLSWLIVCGYGYHDCIYAWSSQTYASYKNLLQEYTR